MSYIDSEQQLSKSQIIKYAIIGFICISIIVIFVFIGSLFHIVPASHNGLVIKAGELQDTVKKDGFTLKAPWTDIENVYVGINTTDTPNGVNNLGFVGIDVLTKDSQKMNANVTINYRISNPVIYRRQTGTFDHNEIKRIKLIPQTSQTLKDYASEYTWQELIKESGRKELGDRFYDTLSTGIRTERTCKKEEEVIDKETGLKSIKSFSCSVSVRDGNNLGNRHAGFYGVEIVDTNLRSIDPDEQLLALVEETKRKEQQELIADQNIKIAQKEAQAVEAKALGEQAKREAEINANAHQKEAEGRAEAAALKEVAEGKKALAEAEEALKNALSNSSELITYKKLEIQLIKANAELTLAENYKGNVPNQLTIIGDEAAYNGKFLIGMPNSITVQE